MSQKKEVYEIKRNRKGQFDDRGAVKQITKDISEETQRRINDLMVKHLEMLYKVANRLRWAVWALLVFDIVMTGAFVNFSKQIIAHLGGL